MLLEEFSTIFDRPEKIKKLREYILSLAFRGKLVKQDENDEPASLLLERVREEKYKLVKEKKIKKEKPLSDISEDEIPYELPKGWEWVRFSQVLDVRDGTHDTPKYVENGIPLITSKNINGKDIDFSNVKYISEKDHEEISKRSQVDDGDILFAMIGSIGNPVIVKKRRDFSIKNIALFKYYNSDVVLNTYLYYYLVLHQSYMKERASGAVQSFVSLKFLRTYEFALPPLNEQKRIVEKLDYLMEFCDKLEEQLEKQVKYGSLSAKSVLNGVSNCSSYEELEESLRFIIENFKDLTLADGAVDELKNAILSLAVRGRLVQQDERDEPASILLEKIKEEKDKLVKEKKIKKEKPLPQITENEIPYELPKGWEWVRLSEICSLITDGTHSTPKYTDKGVPFLSVKDLSNGIIDFSNTRFISEEEHNTLIKRCNPQYGDILLTKVGTTGIAKYVDTNKQFSIFVSVALLKIFKEYINPIFLEKTINSPIVRKQSDENTQGVGNKNLVLKCIKNFVIPLPPLNEQKRIVEKVDKLMKICDELECKIEESKEYSKKLMNSLLKEV